MNRFGWGLLICFLIVLVIFVASIRGNQLPSDPGLKDTRQASLVMPVAGVSSERLTHTFDQDREDHARQHQALDIPAPRGTAVVSASEGFVEKLFDSQRGGHTIYIRSADRSWTYYYAHLDRYAAGLREGAKVKPGQQIAFVGSTGNAEPAAPHLHFAIWRISPGDPWYKTGKAIDPYPLLAASAPAR